MKRTLEENKKLVEYTFNDYNDIYDIVFNNTENDNIKFSLIYYYFNDYDKYEKMIDKIIYDNLDLKDEELDELNYNYDILYDLHNKIDNVVELTYQVVKSLDKYAYLSGLMDNFNNYCKTWVIDD